MSVDRLGFFFLVVFPFPHDLLIKFLSGNIAISLIHSKCDSMLKVAFKKLIFFYLKGLYTQSGLEKLSFTNVTPINYQRRRGYGAF